MTEEEKKDFVVRDKRAFAEEAQSDTDTDSDPDLEKEDSRDQAQAEPEEEKETGSGKAQGDTRMPEMNFPTFIFSLNASALFHLGMVEDPTTGKKERNLPLAKQTIDILGMLEKKTRGNLSNDEENLLKNILTDLRLMYVKETSP